MPTTSELCQAAFRLRGLYMDLAWDVRSALFRIASCRLIPDSLARSGRDRRCTSVSSSAFRSGCMVGSHVGQPSVTRPFHNCVSPGGAPAAMTAAAPWAQKLVCGCGGGVGGRRAGGRWRWRGGAGGGALAAASTGRREIWATLRDVGVARNASTDCDALTFLTDAVPATTVTTSRTLAVGDWTQPQRTRAIFTLYPGR